MKQKTIAKLLSRPLQLRRLAQLASEESVYLRDEMYSPSAIADPQWRAALNRALILRGHPPEDP